MFGFRKRNEIKEAEADARIEHAERELSAMQARIDAAMLALDRRQRENNWRESIERMIKGVA